MNSNKRMADDISSSDEDGPIFPLRKVMRRAASPPVPNNDNLGASHQSFEEFLANNVPLSLADAAVTEYLIWQSNKRLDRARQENIDIHDITIGEECLPVWPTFFWDPSIEPLHAIVKRHLDELEMAQKLGSLVRKDIITKSNQKLQEAKDLGVGLHEIAIGNGLLPHWGYPIVDDLSDDSDEDKDSQESSENRDVSSSPTSIGATIEEPLISTMWDSFLKSAGYESLSSDSENSDSDIGSECNDGTSEHDIMYQITMNNVVDDQAYFSDGSTNVFHDAQIVGGSRDHSYIDFEFRPATEEDEIEDLIELEFAVGRAAFDYYFETDDGIDVEVPGVQLRCTGEIESIVEVDDDGNELEDADAHPLRFIQTPAVASVSPKRPSTQIFTCSPCDTQMDVVEVPDDKASETSEEETDDEVQRQVFEETAEGFK
ncbi:Fc.00g075500.m01.CDS01 [Cosmosporella sp. VM-42]